MKTTATPQRNKENAVSRWNTAFNPIVFGLKRSDYSISSVANDNGNYKLTLDKNISDISVNDYVSFTEGGTKKKKKVLAVSGATLTLEYTFVSPLFQGGDYLNRFYNVYYLIVSAYSESGLIASMRIMPNPKDEVKINPSSLLQSIITRSGVNNYAVVPTLENSGKYKLTYKEYKDGTAGLETTIQPDGNEWFYVVDSAKQIGDKYGQNMLEYVPYIHNSTNKVVNGGFDTNSNNWTIANNGATATNNVTTGNLFVNVTNWNGNKIKLTPTYTLEKGKVYTLSVNISAVSDAILKVYLNGGAVKTITTTGNHTHEFTANDSPSIYLELSEDQDAFLGSIKINFFSIIEKKTAHKAKFLTAFPKSIEFKGFPFSISAIIPKTGDYKLVNTYDYIAPITDNQGNPITTNTNEVITQNS